MYIWIVSWDFSTAYFNIKYDIQSLFRELLVWTTIIMRFKSNQKNMQAYYILLNVTILTYIYIVLLDSCKFIFTADKARIYSMCMLKVYFCGI